MTTICEPAVIRAFFGERRRTVARLRTSGFSGSEILLVEEAAPPTAPARWVVKSFGRGTPTDRAAWIHGFMNHLRRRGIEGIPMLRQTLPGEVVPDVGVVAETLAKDVDGVLWEVVEFLPGRPVAVPDAVARSAAAGKVPRPRRTNRTGRGDSREAVERAVAGNGGSAAVR